jgi:hypothetical protein
MESFLSTIAFALLIGAQFLGAIVLISRRNEIYGIEPQTEAKKPPPEQVLDAVVEHELPAKAA